MNKDGSYNSYFFGLFSKNVKVIEKIHFLFILTIKNVEMTNNKLNQIQEKTLKAQDDEYYNGFLTKRSFNENLYEFPVPKEPLKGVYS